MKKYIVYIVYTSLLFIFGGCDVLDKYPLDKPNQDTSKETFFYPRN